MKNLAYIFTFLFLMSCGSSSVEGIKTVGVSEFKKQTQREDVQLLDVRTPAEYIQGHIPYSLNFDIKSSDFKDRIALLDTLKPVLVYCKSGGRSAKAATILKEKGFKEIYDLEDGFTGWSKKEEKIEQ